MTHGFALFINNKWFKYMNTTHYSTPLQTEYLFMFSNFYVKRHTIISVSETRWPAPGRTRLWRYMMSCGISRSRITAGYESERLSPDTDYISGQILTNISFPTNSQQFNTDSLSKFSLSTKPPPQSTRLNRRNEIFAQRNNSV